MNDDQPDHEHLHALKAEHRRLDAEIDALVAAGVTDQLEVARLKRRKLRIKDEIQVIVDLTVPDIIA